MTKDNTKDDTGEFVQVLETLSFVKTLASLISIASLLYAFGFVIVNIHLANKGIRDFELTRPTYISAGTAFVIQTLFLVLVTYLVVDTITNRIYPAVKKSRSEVAEANPRKRTISWKAAGIVTLIIIIISALCLYSNLTFVQELLKALIPEYIVSIVLATSLMSLLVRLFKKPSVQDRSIVWGLSSVSIIIVFFVFSFLWGRQVYPKLPPEFGGGGQVLVQLVIQ